MSNDIEILSERVDVASVQQQIEDALCRLLGADLGRINLDVMDGTVRLTGRVASGRVLSRTADAGRYA